MIDTDSIISDLIECSPGDAAEIINGIGGAFCNGDEDDEKRFFKALSKRIDERGLRVIFLAANYLSGKRDYPEIDAYDAMDFLRYLEENRRMAAEISSLHDVIRQFKAAMKGKLK